MELPDLEEKLEANRGRDARWTWTLGVILMGLGTVAGVVFVIASLSRAVARGIEGVGIEDWAGGYFWAGTDPLNCDGTMHVIATNVTSAYPITASGNCHVQLSNVTLTASNGITATGDAHVSMAGGRVTGAVDASGNARVTFEGTPVTGPIQTSGNARVIGAR